MYLDNETVFVTVFASIHHHNGFKMKQSGVMEVYYRLSALIKRFNKSFALTFEELQPHGPPF